MRVTRGHFVMAMVAVGFGLLLLILGRTWGAVWVLGGRFFVVLGIGAGLLTLAWWLPGPVGAFLRRPIVSVLIVAAVVIMMALVVYAGITSGGG